MKKKIHQVKTMCHRLVSTTSTELILKLGYSSYHLSMQQGLIHYMISNQHVKLFITSLNEFTEL